MSSRPGCSTADRRLDAQGGVERRASGGILAPILTHVTWSLSMLVVLPLVFVA